MKPIMIVGAGIAGLACARRLVQGGIQPILLDKGRGIGGRVATRRADTLRFDHGAQYVTAKGEGFAALLRDLVSSGDAAPWPAEQDGERIVGTPGMASLAKAMARGLEVHQGVQVSSIRPTDGGWQVIAGEARYASARIVVTVPAPQVAGLLGPEHAMAASVESVRMAPCLTLMAGIAAPAPFVTREAADEPLAWIAQDSAKPHRPSGGAVAWVAQAGPAFSAAHLEDDAATIAARMMPLLCDRLGVTVDKVTHASAHRWRYARVTTALGQPFLRDAGGTLYLGGDWCLGPRVEAAWTSGTAIADDLLATLQ